MPRRTLRPRPCGHGTADTLALVPPRPAVAPIPLGRRLGSNPIPPHSQGGQELTQTGAVGRLFSQTSGWTPHRRQRGGYRIKPWGDDSPKKSQLGLRSPYDRRDEVRGYERRGSHRARSPRTSGRALVVPRPRLQHPQTGTLASPPNARTWRVSNCGPDARA